MKLTEALKIVREMISQNYHSVKLRDVYVTLNGKFDYKELTAILIVLKAMRKNSAEISSFTTEDSK